MRAAAIRSSFLGAGRLTTLDMSRALSLPRCALLVSVFGILVDIVGFGRGVRCGESKYVIEFVFDRDLHPHPGMVVAAMHHMVSFQALLL